MFLSLNDEAYAFSEITTAQFHKIIEKKHMRNRQTINYEFYNFKDLTVMNVNTNLSATERFVFFETRDRNENFLQTKTNQFQITRNF